MPYEIKGYVKDSFILWAMWVIVWVMFLGQMTHAKRRAQPTFWGFVGNVGHQFQSL